MYQSDRSGAVFLVITLESILGCQARDFERILRKYRDQKWAKTVTEKNFKKFRRPND